MRVDWDFLQGMLDCQQTMIVGTPSFNQKYIDFVDNPMISNKQWRQKVEEWGKNEKVNVDAYSLFNEALFLQIPSENNLLEDFAKIISEKIKVYPHFFCFKKLYDELRELQNSEYDTRVFETCSSPVQMRVLKSEISDQDYEKYLDLANKDVQNIIFEEALRNNRLFEHSFKSDLYREHKDKVELAIISELEDRLEMSDVVGAESTLERCSKSIFGRLPDDVKNEFINIFTEKYTELIKTEQLTFKQLESRLTGEELLELLAQNVFEQKEGEVYHLYFDTPYSDILKLIDISKRYKISCSITIKSCADLPIETIDMLRNNLGIDIKEVRIKQEDLDKHQQIPYSIEDYINCRKIIDTIIKDVEDITSPANPNSDKKVFGIVARRLANLIRYNYEYYHRMKKQATEEEHFINASMVGGLLNGTCVCAGYAEILRNVLACCRIECKYVSADNKDKNEEGHAWNQVKLDGKWYNVDLTWDADRIVAGQSTRYLLKSDNDFGHTGYVPRKHIDKCQETIHDVDKYYLEYGRPEQNIEFIDLLRRAIVTNGITKSESDDYAKVASAREHSLYKQ